MQLLQNPAHLCDEQRAEYIVELSSHLHKLMQRETFFCFQQQIMMVCVLEVTEQVIDVCAFLISEVLQALQLVLQMLLLLCIREVLFANGLPLYNWVPCTQTLLRSDALTIPLSSLHVYCQGRL